MDFEKQIASILSKLEIEDNDEDFASFAIEKRDISAEFVRQMKINKDFEKYFASTTFGGGNSENLKNLDDLILYVQLKIDNQLKPVTLPEHAGYIRIEAAPNGASLWAENGFISTMKLQRWMQNIWQNILNQAHLQIKCSTGRIFDIKYRCIEHSGNARHLFGISNDEGHQFDIELVPCFVFEPIHCPFPKIVSTNSMWLAVPKAKRNFDNCFSAVAPELEEKMFKGFEHVNQAMRLLKAIRKKNKLPQLNNYMIRNLFLVERKIIHKRSFWQKPVGEIVLFMLDRLICVFRNGKLSSFLDPTINLFDNFDANATGKYLQVLIDVKKVYYFQRDCCRFSVHPNPSLYNIFGAKVDGIK